MGELEVSSSDVVKLILQFLRENGLKETFQTLQDETQQTLNAVDNPAAFLSDIKNGRWEQVLPLITEMRLSVGLVQNLVEQMVMELVEVRERETARLLLGDSNPALLLMKAQDTERFLRLERLINSPSISVDPSDLFGNQSKEQRRLSLSKGSFSLLSLPLITTLSLSLPLIL